MMDPNYWVAWGRRSLGVLGWEHREAFIQWLEANPAMLDLYMERWGEAILWFRVTNL